MKTIVWIQVDSLGIFSSEGLELSEEDFNLFQEDPSPEKHLFRAEFDDAALLRIIDVETGEDMTPVPEIRNLALSRALGHRD